MTACSFTRRRQLGIGLGAILLAAACCAPLPASDQKPDPGPSKSPPPCPPLFRDLPPLGAETPRAAAERLLNGLLEGDRRQVLSCFDLQSARSLAAALTYADTAELLVRTRKFKDTLEKRFGQRGIDAVRGELGIELQPRGAVLSRQDVKEYLARLEVVTEGGTSVARVPNPLGKDTWLRLHKLEGRWYVTAPPESRELATATGAAWLERWGQILKQAGEALEKSTSLEQFRHRLKELKAKDEITPALGLAEEQEPGTATKPLEEGKAEKLPAQHFRAEVTSRLDPGLGEAVASRTGH